MQTPDACPLFAQTLHCYSAVKQIPFMPIDGTDSVNKDIRTRLWEISGQKLKYPQLFLYDKAEDAYEFLGGA